MFRVCSSEDSCFLIKCMIYFSGEFLIDTRSILDICNILMKLSLADMLLMFGRRKYRQVFAGIFQMAWKKFIRKETH